MYGKIIMGATKRINYEQKSRLVKKLKMLNLIRFRIKSVVAKTYTQHAIKKILYKLSSDYE